MRDSNASANQRIVFEFHKQLASTNSTLVNAEGTRLDPEIVEDPTTSTFSFGITLALKRPLKL
jgi:hypothetical protein